MPENLLQNRDIGSRQNGAGGERMTQVVQVDHAANSYALANSVMGPADTFDVVTGSYGTRKDPVFVGVLLSALLEEIEHLLAHRETAFGVSGFATDDDDGAVLEVEILIRHPKDFIGPHALAEHDDGDGLEGLTG